MRQCRLWRRLGDHAVTGQSNCVDGAYPQASLVQATDGNFYGTVVGGGQNGIGAVYKVTPSGSLTTLYSFHNSDGSEPFGGLIQARDGNLYGTTNQGGRSGYGTVFRLGAIRPCATCRP
ncbi:MAG TPA: choice-of-anchor tandem repeat GloVer-containing protein [Candidatus Limnocylindrales bacterium]|jgi:uncharacterized repeat protein (TIGR03803 family)|nr:choice-of-anchor tandem repeat GloVer-containing protein [Candidatus Limnocylindrales bacterium]